MRAGWPCLKVATASMGVSVRAGGRPTAALRAQDVHRHFSQGGSRRCARRSRCLSTTCQRWRAAGRVDRCAGECEWRARSRAECSSCWAQRSRHCTSMSVSCEQQTTSNAQDDVTVCAWSRDDVGRLLDLGVGRRVVVGQARRVHVARLDARRSRKHRLTADRHRGSILDTEKRPRTKTCGVDDERDRGELRQRVGLVDRA